ncbi:MAG: hypothetical protein DWQ37_02040 [Planctomycetota bacterium]|nr:MAG: hypothetical protein DWQ37_02040 [Planctomycetota bacterium]
MKHLLLPLLAAAAVVLPAARCSAQDESGTKPVAVLAIASYDRLMTDIAFIGNLAGSPDLDKNIEGMIQLFTQGQGLAGLDKTRPLGVTLATDGVSFQPLIVLPVTDLQQLLAALEGLVGVAQDAGDGVFELDVFNQKIFVKEENKWAYLSTSPEILGDLPQDGGDLFDGLEKKYDIAGRLHVQNVPEVFRTMLIDQLRIGVEQGLSRQSGESDEAFEARREMVEAQMEQLTDAINELEQLTLGLALDPNAKTAQLDLSFAALEGTDSAKAFAKAKPTSASSFAGFLVPDAAASLNLTTELAESDAEQFVAGLDAVRTQALQQIEGEDRLPDEASKKLATEMVNQVFDAIRATFESGKVDAAATLDVSDEKMALAVGAYVADPQSLDEALKKFAKLMADEPDFPDIKFDADKHDGVVFHTASIPVPQDQKIAKVLGENLDVAVGIGEKSVYLALGTDSLEMTKKLIDGSKTAADKQLPPFQLTVSLGPVFEFASALQDDGDGESNVKMMAAELAKSPGKDHVRLEYIPESSGATIRVTAEEGALKLLGSLLKNAQASGALPGFGP